MLTLITSCGRPDLLTQTINSLVENQVHKLAIAINEDSESVSIIPPIPNTMINTYHVKGRNQHASIEKFLRAAVKGVQKYYLHCEDDWLFDNSYDWITESIKIMQNDPKIIKVLCRFDSPHPCEHNININDTLSYGILESWGNEGILWKGFSWNPGVTRLDLLSGFMPFPKTEQELAELIYNEGYKVAELSIPIYKHLGDGKSTY